MNRYPLASTVASLMGLLVINTGFAADGSDADYTEGAVTVTSSVQSTADREASRREDRSERIGHQAIEAGDRAMEEKDYEKAFAQYKLAVDNIPNAPRSRGLYNKAMDSFCDAGVKLAEQRIAEGRYADAEITLQLILEERYNPKCKEAVLVLSRLETPGYINRTITPRFRGSVEEVKKMMVEADGFYQTGRYDLAFKRCEQILNIDRYNIAARKMEEKINAARSNYTNAAYNEARSRAMWKLEDAWGNPVRKFGLDNKSAEIVTTSPEAANTARIQAKLNRIIIPKLEFKNATITEAINYLKDRSAVLDIMETVPAQKGVNIVLKLESASNLSVPGVPEAAPIGGGIPGLDIPGMAPATDPAAMPGVLAVSPGDVRITISLSNIPLGAALRYVTELANLKFKVEPYAVSIVPIGTPTDILVTREYKVRPGIFTRPAASGGNALDTAGVPADATRTPGGTGIAGRVDAKESMMSSGVAFPPGSAATYLPSSSKLIVRNTQENLELVEALVQETDNRPAQVEIESKFVEITQNDLKELSFDWLIGQFNIGKGGVFGSGGTAGNQPAIDSQNYPFVAPGGTPVGSQPVTGGTRSGSNALSASAIDALLFGVSGAAKLAPGIAALSGVFTDPQFQVVIRALNQKKGVDLLSAPRVTTKSGQKATIEIIREFRYPTEFDPPQIPQTFAQPSSFSLVGAASPPPASFPVTPTTPTAFETRNTGVTLEVEPIIAPDGYTIDLSLVPQVVEFEGFINYGSPIQSSSTSALGVTQTNVITPNTINQPIFSTRKVTTNVSVFDGQTVVLGGLMREDVQKVEDKVPLLGDIPLIGRLFRSSVDQHIKRNLVIFVSARLITPAGELFRPDEEVEEIVEVLSIPEIAPLELPLMGKDK